MIVAYTNVLLNVKLIRNDIILREKVFHSVLEWFRLSVSDWIVVIYEINQLLDN